MRKVLRILTIVGFLGLGTMTFTSCSLDSEQSNYIDGNEPITSTEKLIASLNGAYARMTSSTYYGRDIIVFSEARAPYAYSSDRTGRFGNVSAFALQTTHSYAKDTWLQIYRTITNANKVIEAALETSEKNNYYKGQAYVIRALAHYDLVRIYGEQYVNGEGLAALGVPYKTLSHSADESIKRMTVRENMEAIYADLEQGIAYLKAGKEAGLEGNSLVKAKINYAAALGLQSRIALFFSQFDESQLELVVAAAEQAIEARGNVVVLPRAGYIDGYKTDGIMTNSLFELAQSGTDNQFTNSLQYIYSIGSNGGYGDVQWLPATVEAVFDPADGNDIRAKVITVDGVNDTKALRNTGKYVVRSSNIRMLRIEEVMLNYVEATLEGAGNGDMGQALDYMNQIVGSRVVTIKDGVETPKQFTSIKKKDLQDLRMKEMMFEGFGFEDAMRWRKGISNPKITDNDDLGESIEFGNPLLAFPIPEAEINVSKIQQNQAYK
ncbi:RagB/SusD family nutrient uptake outer membrane protein [Myroides pelagicus]|uniref:RagB/SusD family nutrient uptake outer membrane protein n=1 Tax=Myroides pelagicus TaxID=270914 RepID=A0A7K1GIV7_9FLAO|nr:RagB/SusD family nutrient uptake outer membrane protein [Myroides pelagicus]MEC4113720.1 RagB/SusD family nutrient uptake outer membrane protein [Myroides pelagicus]MTH28822.1 RagB/SusD family nutrient uptake outer membrane protein [Myroides pelagicus]